MNLTTKCDKANMLQISYQEKEAARDALSEQSYRYGEMNNVELKEPKNILRAMRFGCTTFEKRTGVKHRNRTKLFD